MPPKRIESSVGIIVGQPVLATKNKAKFIGICHAIDSRIEGNRIIKEVKVLVVACQGDGEQFYSPLPAENAVLFEMKEVRPLVVDTRPSADA